MSAYNEQRKYERFINEKTSIVYPFNLNDNEYEIHDIKGKFTICNRTKKIVYPVEFRTLTGIVAYAKGLK